MSRLKRGIDSPLPIVVGVTGHRDLRIDDVPRLEHAFASALQGIADRYPHSSVVLLSALAEGADRLAARVALSLGIRLVVPLPMPRAVYETDFATADSRREFSDLLDRASAVIALPALPGATEEAIAQTGPARDREYAKAGAYIVRHSQIFFAFWDGVSETPNSIGGTAQTVSFRLEGVPAPYARPHRPLMFATPTGPVIQIDTPRRSRPGAGAVAGESRLRLPPGGSRDAFDRICARINLFNADAHALEEPLRLGDATAKAYLLNVPKPEMPVVLQSLSETCRRIADQYALADGLAVHFAARTRETWKHVFVGAGAAAIAFQIHGTFFSVSTETPTSLSQAFATLPWFLIFVVVLSTFTATWTYGRAERREYQTKYQDYRAIAEALRIQFFWKIASVPDPVVDHFLRQQRSELEWIRSALKSFDVLNAAAGGAHLPAAPTVDRLRLVMSWIGDQRRYFVLKARLEEERLRKESAVVVWCLRLGGGVSFVLAAILAVPFLSSLTSAAWLQGLALGPYQYGGLMIGISALAVAAGLLDAYGRQLGRAEHVRQFTRMSDLFGAAEGELAALVEDDRYEAATALVRDLGIEALDETGDWLILHRERPLEVPAG